MEGLVVLVGLLHLLLTPFTKVEESFNIQAVHDLLYLRSNISDYDHLEFSGVVPRTFVGPLFLAAVSSPLVFLASLFNIGSKFLAQYIVRGVLSLCVTLSLIRLQRSLRSNLGGRYGWWFLLISASQYHLLYYSSRPLPNTLALPLVLLALSCALSPGGATPFLVLSGAAVVWFRTELALLLGFVLLIQLVDGHVRIPQLVKIGVPTGIALVATTILVDSFFWRRLLWPELEVFFFNVVLNKSGEWGTSPFLWYFYSALPRGLGLSVLLLPLGVALEPRVRRLVLAATLFVFCFSFLPHKELRFIIYTFPLFNTAVAAACHRLWENRRKSPLHLTLALGVAGHIAVNVSLTIFLLVVARTNYPGGEAMTRLHQLVSPDFPAYVHIENLAAQTGVSRFTQINPNWRYSKVENLTRGSIESLQFTHLLVEAKSKYSVNLKPYAKTHTVLAAVEGFSEIAMNYQLFPPVRIKTKPQIFILERRRNLVVPQLVREERWKPEESEELDEEDFEEEKDLEEEEPLEERSSTQEDAEEGAEMNQEDEEIGDDSLNDAVIEDKEFKREEPTEPEDLDDLLAVETQKSEDKMQSEEDQLEPYNKIRSEEEQLELDNKIQSEEDQLGLDDIVRQLEERLSSGEAQEDKNQLVDALFESDILNDIMTLSHIDFGDSRPDVDKLKEALKSILDDYKKRVVEEIPKTSGEAFPEDVRIEKTVSSEANSKKKAKKIKKRKVEKPENVDDGPVENEGEEIEATNDWFSLLR